ncbi:MAG TPA: hypothetical protein VME17_08905 [Bryobacteraceae bacterium]|nr:hypothetical protein [Bryobacteraceae bacterium]
MRIHLLIAALAVWPLAAQTPAPARAPSGFPLGPAAHVDSFTAQPSTIKPGQSTTLHWAVVNADNTSIDNGIGIVPTRGSRKVTPKVTTTYTFLASGRGGADKRSITVTVIGTKPAAEPVEAANKPQPVPRMSDGKPDLSGVYIGGFAVRPIDKIEIKPGAEKFKMTAKELELGPGVLCVPPGVPAATMQPYPLQIVEKPGLVVILYEAYHLFRVIPTDGRKHPDDMDPTWMGNSVGHWEGDTLVVDVAGFNNKTDIAGYHHTTAYHVVERYTRPTYDQINYEATIEDPNVFAKPWRYAGPLKLHPEWDLQEYVCEENNKDYKELFENK